MEDGYNVDNRVKGSAANVVQSGSIGVMNLNMERFALPIPAQLPGPVGTLVNQKHVLAALDDQRRPAGEPAASDEAALHVDGEQLVPQRRCGEPEQLEGRSRGGGHDRSGSGRSSSSTSTRSGCVRSVAGSPLAGVAASVSASAAAPSPSDRLSTAAARRQIR